MADKDPRVWNLWVESTGCEPDDYIWGYYSDLWKSYNMDDPSNPHRAFYLENYFIKRMREGSAGRCRAGSQGSAKKVTAVAVNIPLTAAQQSPTAAVEASAATTGFMQQKMFGISAPLVLAGAVGAFMFFGRRR